MQFEKLVAVARSGSTRYPARSPFHPPAVYPEFSALLDPAKLDGTNQVYPCVREALRLLRLDADNVGTARWNPLSELIEPGARVMIKPNWVREAHHLNDSWEQIITHGSVLRAVLDYVRLALRGRGKIALADGPMLTSNFEAILERTGIDRVRAFCAEGAFGIEVEVLDLRSQYLHSRRDVIMGRRDLPGDPAGGVVVDLGASSLFYAFRGEGRYYGADYDTDEVNAHHRGIVQEYKLSATAIGADLLIDVPKLKAHSKSGVTMALKGIVGLNSGRNWLPHRTQGTPQQGGDQFDKSSWRQELEWALVRRFEQASLRHPRTVPAIYQLAKTIGKRVFGPTHRTIRGGAWRGNETLWRMALDINRALTYADAEGRLHDAPVRRRLCIIDGIIAGEGQGPVYADPKSCGVILAGRNPVAVDITGAELMGFSYEAIPMLAQALTLRDYRLIGFGADEIQVASTVPEWEGGIDALRRAEPFRFAPPIGWANWIERGSPRAVG